MGSGFRGSGFREPRVVLAALGYATHVLAEELVRIMEKDRCLKLGHAPPL